MIGLSRAISNRFRYAFYRRRGFSATESYRRLMNHRVITHGPDHAVGAFDCGRAQFQFIRDHEGLEPTDRLLDIGCGTLRGGEHFIDYLDPERYTGMDISGAALEAGFERLDDEMAREKRPQLILNNDLRFGEIRQEADVAVAQSVLTHLPHEDVEEFLAHIGDVLAPGGAFYATIFVEGTSPSSKDFVHDFEAVRGIAERHELESESFPADSYAHPNQRWIRFTKR